MPADKGHWRDPNADYNFINIEDNVFAPAYEIIAEDVLRDTGMCHGILLDIGCGGGHLGRAIMRRTDQQGIFLDVNTKAIGFAKERAETDGLTDRCTFYCADVEQMPIADDSVNLVVSRGSMQFWDNLKNAFREIYRVMAPGAKTYIGGGCGNAELFASISRQMDELGVDWGGKHPNQDPELTTEQMCAMFDRMGFSYQVKDEDDAGKGRWFIITK